MPSIRTATVFLLAAAPLLAEFDMSRHSIPPEKILGGEPPKDGIPAILEPRFVESFEATFLKPVDIVRPLL
jgi:hypothetical protein